MESRTGRDSLKWMGAGGPRRRQRGAVVFHAERRRWENVMDRRRVRRMLRRGWVCERVWHAGRYGVHGTYLPRMGW